MLCTLMWRKEERGAGVGLVPLGLVLRIEELTLSLQPLRLPSNESSPVWLPLGASPPTCPSLRTESVASVLAMPSLHFCCWSLPLWSSCQGLGSFVQKNKSLGIRSTTTDLPR